MWIRITELVLLLLIICATWWIWRRSIGANLHTIIRQVLCALSAYGVAYLSWHMMQHTSAGLPLQLTTVLIVGIMAYAGPIWLTRRVCSNREPTSWRWANHIGNALLILLFLGGLLFVADVCAALLTKGEWAKVVSQNTFLMNRLIASHTPDEEQQLQSIIDQQNQLLSGLATQFQSTRQYVYDATGLSGFLDQFEMVRQIASLSGNERAWLVNQNKSLKALMSHPDVLAAVQNEHVNELMDQIVDGDITAVYALGQHPQVIQLIDNKTLHKLIANIDLKEILKQLENRKAEDFTAAAEVWHLKSMSKETNLEAAMTSTEGWTADTNGNNQLQWQTGTQYGIAVTQYTVTEPITTAISLQTDGQPEVWLEDQPVELHQTDTNWIAILALTPDQNRLSIVIDFRRVQTVKECHINVIEK